jgi:hypothetical protein
MAGSGGNFSGTDSYPVDMENSYPYTQTSSSQVFYCCQFLYETISVNTAGNHEKEN